MLKKKTKRRNKKIREIKNPWFRKRRGLFSPDLGWGWVPITWQGGLMILIFLGIIFCSAFSFGLAEGREGSVLKFLTTLFLSLAVFSIIAWKKTRR